MKQIAAALVKAQKAFGPALKTNTNPAFRSKYADLSACVEAVIDALNSNGIALIQKTHRDDCGVTVETIFVHESGEEISSGCLHVPASKQDPQGYGSALTYARRYSLMAACGIAPEDDDGNAASKPAAQPAQQPAQKAAPQKPASRPLDVEAAQKSIRTAKTEAEATKYRDAAMSRCANDEQRELIRMAWMDFEMANMTAA